MRTRLALVVGLLASTASAQDTFWYEGNAAVLVPALQAALLRYRAATCLPLDVSLVAMHTLRLSPAAQMGGRSGWTTGPTWASADIKLLDTLTTAQLVPVLMHELSHLLRESNDHPGPDGSFSYSAVHVVAEPRSHITPTDLVLICAKQPCGCFVPEE